MEIQDLNKCKVKECRVCKKSDFTKILDLGFHPPVDDFLTKERLDNPEIYYPLELYICNNCSLVQLGYVVPPEILYQNDYPYESSTTKTGVTHFHAFAKEAYQRFGLKENDLVIDIGSNVGVLLEGFKIMGAKVLGIDPAENICKIARERGIDTINDFISESAAQKIESQYGKAKIVTGTNVVAHIDDHHALVRSLDTLLDKDGVFIFEAPYLVDLIEKFEYDTIYHEHLAYLSLKPMQILFEQFGMEIFDMKKVSIHGGTVRYFIARKGQQPICESIAQFQKLEEESKIYDIATLNEFAKNVEKNRQELRWLLEDLKHQGKTIAGLSAPAKGMTLLNYCKIGTETLDFLTEKSRLKIGKFSPGGHIPVLSDNDLIEKRPDYALLLAWNFAEEIMKNLQEYKDKGGKFIIPIPRPHVVE